MIKKTLTTCQIGQLNECLARQYLIQQGLRYLTQNFHSRQGEIDLIMQEQETLVFIEVKYRKNNNFGGAIAAVSYNKQQRLRKTATFYLQRQGLNAYNTPCRFDVITIQGNTYNNSTPQMTWLKNAF
jgi:putative endonuclease